MLKYSKITVCYKTFNYMPWSLFFRWQLSYYSCIKKSMTSSCPFSISYFHFMIRVFGSGALVSQNMIDQCGSSGIMCQSYIIILLKKSNPIFLTPAVSFMIEIFIQIISQLYLTHFNLPDLFLLLVPSILFQNTMAAFGYFCPKSI